MKCGQLIAGCLEGSSKYDERGFLFAAKREEEWKIQVIGDDNSVLTPGAVHHVTVGIILNAVLTKVDRIIPISPQPLSDSR